ncbi:MAG: DUF2268 domain-containing putative Zn-dependent protease [Pseudomonadota bacterium]
MAIRFHVMQASGAYTGETLAVLERALARTAAACGVKLALRDVDVVVMDVPWNVIPRIGINGFAYDAHQIALFTDMAHRTLQRDLAGAVGAILAHELHHAARAVALGSGHRRTYGESLVAEGLACCFEEEMGHPTPFYAVECRGDALARFAHGQARAQIDTPRGALPGAWQKWMFGGAPDDAAFPYQCGYSTGYALVSHWLAQHGTTASQAAGVDADAILAPWREGRIDPFAA